MRVETDILSGNAWDKSGYGPKKKGYIVINSVTPLYHRKKLYIREQIQQILIGKGAAVQQEIHSISGLPERALVCFFFTLKRLLEAESLNKFKIRPPLG